MNFISSNLLRLVVLLFLSSPLISAQELKKTTPAPHPIEYAGYHTQGKSVFVILANRETNEVSSWLRAGQEWKGIRVDSIDEKNETISVAKGTESFVIPLKKGRITDGKTAQLHSPVGFNFIRGDCQWIDGKRVCSSDAVVQFGSDVLSATTGVMVLEGDVIRGNLSVDSAEGKTIEADAATARLVNGQAVLIAGKMRIILPKK